VKTEEPQSEVDILEMCLEVLKARLPAAWAMSPELLHRTGDGRYVDAVLEIIDPEGRAATVVVEAKRVVQGRDVPPLTERLRTLGESAGATALLLASRYLPPPVRQRLAEAGVAFVDATGNVRLELSRPGLYVADKGEDSDPWRGPGRPRGTLKGAPATRVVRALLDIDRDWTVRELVRESGASTGATYRVIEFLDQEGLVERPRGGSLRVVEWEPLLRRWADDYGFVRSNGISRWIAPRGLDHFLHRLQSSNVQHAVTGSLAAEEWAPYAPARSAMVYVADAQGAARDLGLRPTEAGVNVLLAVPDTDAPFRRTGTSDDGLVLAAPAQVAVDLISGPGRNPSEAEELVTWMERNEHVWRRK
jgi:hypothetical protein